MTNKTVAINLLKGRSCADCRLYNMCQIVVEIIKENEGSIDRQALEQRIFSKRGSIVCEKWEPYDFSFYYRRLRHG